MSVRSYLKFAQFKLHIMLLAPNSNKTFLILISRFSPSIFCHLAGIIPCAWILELYLHDVRKNGTSTNKVSDLI